MVRRCRWAAPWVGVVLALWLGAGAATPASGSACMLVFAHRGASRVAPENTLRALDGAVAAEADRVELDVRRTKDGALVLMHDASLVRTTNVETTFPIAPSWHVRQMNYADVATLDAGSWMDGRPARVPRLHSAFARAVPLLLEPKERIAPHRVHAWTVDRDVIVQTFDIEWARRLAEDHPEVPLWLLTTTRPSPDDIAEWGTWADGVAIKAVNADQDAVAEVHAAGMTAAAWTVNDETTARLLLAWGTDAVITDRISAMRSEVGC